MWPPRPVSSDNGRKALETGQLAEPVLKGSKGSDKARKLIKSVRSWGRAAGVGRWEE